MAINHKFILKQTPNAQEFEHDSCLDSVPWSFQYVKQNTGNHLSC